MESTAHSQDEQAQILNRVMALSQEAIIVTRLDGVVASWSRGAERMFGFLEDEITERSILAIIPKDRSREFSDLLDRISSGGSVDELTTVPRSKLGEQIGANFLKGSAPQKKKKELPAG